MTRYIIAAAATAAFLAAFGWWADSRGYDRAQGEFSAAQLEIERAARAKERNMQDAADQVTKKLQDRIAVLADNYNRLAAASRGLRQAIAARAGGNTAASSGGDGGPVSVALGQCVDRYSELAGIADGYASQLIALQGWAGVVAPPE